MTDNDNDNINIIIIIIVIVIIFIIIVIIIQLAMTSIKSGAVRERRVTLSTYSQGFIVRRAC